jgi:hypothetical protein
VRFHPERSGKRANVHLVLAALFLLIPGVLGCGGGGEDPVGTFRAAASTLEGTATLHAQVEGELSPPEEEARTILPFQGDLWVDVAAGALEARMTLLGMDLMARYVGGEAFLHWGGKWFYLSPEGSGIFDRDNIRWAVEVLFRLPRFLSMADAEPAGEGQAGQYKVFFLDLRFDYRALAEEAEVRELAVALGRDPSELAHWLEEMDPRIRVGVDKKEKLLRELQLESDIRLEGPVRLGGAIALPSRARFRLHAFFPEFGMEVKVSPPSQAEPFRGL